MKTGEPKADKLTEKEVREIRARYRPTLRNMSRLAEEYGVVASTIHYIVNRKTWAWVK